MSLVHAKESMHIHVRDFPQSKLDSEMNAHFLLNEHGDLYFFLFHLQKSMATCWQIN